MNTDFLYPISISLGDRDFAWRWICFLHLLTLIIALLFLPSVLMLCVLLFLCLSLRMTWDNQSAVRKADSLAAIRSGEWFLGKQEDGDYQDFVRIDSINIFADLVILKLRRYGSTCFVFRHLDAISAEQAHKFQLLAIYFR